MTCSFSLMFCNFLRYKNIWIVLLFDHRTDFFKYFDDILIICYCSMISIVEVGVFHWFRRIKISSWLLVQINYQFFPKVLALLFFHNFFLRKWQKLLQCASKNIKKCGGSLITKSGGYYKVWEKFYYEMPQVLQSKIINLRCDSVLVHLFINLSIHFLFICFVIIYLLIYLSNLSFPFYSFVLWSI